MAEHGDASIMRVACICEDKTLLFYDLEGQQVRLISTLSTAVGLPHHLMNAFAVPAVGSTGREWTGWSAEGHVELQAGSRK